MKELNLLTMPLAGVSLIEASAGTGKTYTIAQLVLRLVLQSQDGLKSRPLRIEEILVVTFTKAATQELKDRIRQNLSAAMQYVEALQAGLIGAGTTEHDAVLVGIVSNAMKSCEVEQLYGRLTQALLFLDDAPIFTIHGFCQRVLSDHSFTTAQAYDQVLQENGQDVLLNIAQKLWRQWLYPASKTQVRLFTHFFASPQHLVEKLHRAMDSDVVDVQGKTNNADVADGTGFNALASGLHAAEQTYNAAASCWAGESEQIKALFGAGMGRSFTKARLPGWLEQLNEYLIDNEGYLSDFAGASRFTQAHIDEKISKSAPQHGLFALIETLEQQIDSIALQLKSQLRHDLMHALESAKQEQNILFFDDLVKRLATAVSNDHSAALINTLRQQYPAALIDEFQDTDQWQYEIFSRLYVKPENNDEAAALAYENIADDDDGSCCLMIGDPKQAIYSFRGADINTYFQARNQVHADRQYTLATNYRSKPELVANVNRLFSLNSNAFCIADFPEYPKVNSPSSFSSKKGLQLSGSVDDCNLSLIQLQGDSKTKVEKSRSEAADKTADFIASVLHNQSPINNKPIEPADIAVLVRSANQASVIKAALLERGVNSVYLAKDSVLHSAEATAFMQLLQALAQPFDSGYINAALTGSLIGFSALKLYTLQQDALQYAELQQFFIASQQLWKGRGFMAMWQKVLQHFEIPERLLTLQEGERCITNLQQLAEIFQSLDYSELALWQKIETFQRWIEQAVENDEHQKLRLETEANLVQIVTIHKSKGLEYELVCCPFLFDAGQSPPSMYSIRFNTDTQGRELYWNSTDSVKTQLANESFAEDVRLLYVALTRAAYHFNFCWGPVKGVDKTALYHLLYGRENSLKSMDDTPFWSVFNALEGFVLNPQDQVSAIASTAEGVTIGCKDTACDKKAFMVKSFKRITSSEFVARSYSALMNHSYDHKAVADDAKERDEQAEAVIVVPEPEFQENIFHFPKGSDAGNFMHQVLEDVVFDQLEQTLPQVLSQQFHHYGFDESLWSEAMSSHIKLCLQTDLVPIGIPLSGLSEDAICKEMGFYMQGLSHAGEVFRHLLQRYRDDHNRSLNKPDALVGESFNAIDGLFKGFIDLTFEHEGKFYVLDYKSNFLGFDQGCYNFDAMHEAIESHLYDLQYLIYLAALQRHLKQRLADYDYDTHMGGAFYLFLRGMNDQNQNGVYYVKPPSDIIDAIEQLFATHGYE